MRVRIRFGKGTKIARHERKNCGLAAAAGALLTPAAVVAFALAAWRFANDLNLAGDFAIPSGLFSHWQVWLIAAATLQFGAYLLRRYAMPPVAPTTPPPPVETEKQPDPESESARKYLV